ncbi:hypothetical protein C9E91_13545 [Rhizobium sp. SEMIA4064]|nr:hypothetical protein C9E91_13545 [Rhizobium sp. SEMIA4064]
MLVSGIGSIGTRRSHGSIALVVGLHAAAEQQAQINIVSLKYFRIDLLSVFKDGDTAFLKACRNLGFGRALADQIGRRGRQGGTDYDAASNLDNVEWRHESFRQAT